MLKDANNRVGLVLAIVCGGFVASGLYDHGVVILILVTAVSCAAGICAIPRKLHLGLALLNVSILHTMLIARELQLDLFASLAVALSLILLIAAFLAAIREPSKRRERT